MTKQVSMDISGNELILIESKTMRDEYVFKDTVMDKVKVVPLIPDTVELTIHMAASYYEVSNDAVESIIRRHRQEFNEYGEINVLKGKPLAEFKSLRQDDGVFKGINALTLITRRGLLRIGMLLTDSLVAKRSVTTSSMSKNLLQMKLNSGRLKENYLNVNVDC